MNSQHQVDSAISHGLWAIKLLNDYNNGDGTGMLNANFLLLLLLAIVLCYPYPYCVVLPCFIRSLMRFEIYSYSLSVIIQEVMLEFRAGKMSLEGKRVVADTRKGLIRIGRVGPNFGRQFHGSGTWEHIYVISAYNINQYLFFRVKLTSSASVLLG